MSIFAKAPKSFIKSFTISSLVAYVPGNSPPSRSNETFHSRAFHTALSVKSPVVPSLISLTTALSSFQPWNSYPSFVRVGRARGSKSAV